MAGTPLQTEFEFTLPQGYTDDEGTLHREGRMRLATAADEIDPLQDPKVQANSSYLTIILLSRVVTDLGDLDTVDRSVIENLFVSDLEYLQAMYERVNNPGSNAVETACPDCGEAFAVSVYDGAVVESGAQSPSPGGDATSPGASGPDVEMPGEPDAGGDGGSGK
jgi:hypothetical protein